MANPDALAGAPAGPMAAPAAGPYSPAYVRYALILLLVVYTLNFLDRQIVNILAEPIRKDLNLQDWQLGLMTGLAFALFYTVLGIPIARYADRPSSNRPMIIAISLAVWSGMTALCGLAQNFVQLLLARIGVGVGEAGCTPPAHSLIGDYVPQEKRASAIAFYGLGVPAGSLMGLALGGVLADQFGWRTAFMAVGVPGVILALIVIWTLREPRLKGTREAIAAAQTKAGPGASFGEAMGEILRSRAFIYLAIGTAVIAFLGYGKGVWATILFQRSHGLSAGDTGLFYGVSTGIAGMLGMWLGGFLGDKFGKKDPRHYVTGPALAMLLTTPILYFGYMSTDWRLALLLIFIPAIANNMYYGPTFALVQSLVSTRARAMAAAIMLLIINLIGLGFGPLLFGILSDLLKPQFGKESVRYVLVSAAMMGVIPAFFYWLASRRLAVELKRT